MENNENCIEIEFKNTLEEIKKDSCVYLLKSIFNSCIKSKYYICNRDLINLHYNYFIF